MSWSVIVRRGDNTPLGNSEIVEQAIASVFPEVHFYFERSGFDKIAMMRERGIEYPEVIRRFLEQQPQTRQGDFEGDGFSMRFLLGPPSELAFLLVELRGQTERAVRMLGQLTKRTGWVIEQSSGERLAP